MNIGYARVSTKDQNLDMQISALEKAGCEKIFIEKKSGVRKRPELEAAMNYLREGDNLYVYKFDRIGRSLRDLLNIFQTLRDRKIGIVSIMDHIDASTASGEFMMNIFAALSEFERAIIAERCTAGRTEALKKGVKFGRPKGVNKTKAEKCLALYNSGLSIADIQMTLGIKSTSTIYRFLEAQGVKPQRKTRR